MTLKIGFDIQPLQTTSRNRGIGRYSENLINKILEIDQSNNYKLFFNGNFKENVDIKSNKNTQLIKINYLDAKDTQERIANNLVQFLKYCDYELDVFYIMSTFEGYPINSAVINPYFDRLNSFVCTTIYDFIPIRFSEFYLSNPVIREVVYRQLKIVYHSDILFAISESTRIDAINFLGINPKKVVTIWGGISDSFYQVDNLSSKKIENIKKKYGINDKFVLYVGGIEFRKNIEKSIEAFSKIDKSLLVTTSYVIVCEIRDVDRKRLTELAKSYGVGNNVIFTGYLPDEELNILYNCCDVFIFPSLMEGLGIPILEAMKCGSAIIGSNNSSTAELIEDKEFLFNPEKEEEIALLINKSLMDQTFRKKSIDHSLRRCRDFSWDNVAQKVVYTLNSLDKEISKKRSRNNLRKPKIALFSPLPPKKSGISYYMINLLPLLSKYWDIDIFIDEGYVCNEPFITSNFKIYSYHEFEILNQTKQYDSIVYQIGNSDNHIYMFDMLKRYPGVVVLHDVFLSGVMYWTTVRLGKIDEFMEEVVYAHGESGKNLVNQAKNNLISWDKVINELQINKRVLDNATEIILHSKWDEKNILQLYPQYSDKITLTHQFSPIRIRVNDMKNKLDLGFSKNDFLVCSFGFVAPTKKIDSIIRNIKNFLQKQSNVKYVLVGDVENTYGQQIKQLVKDLNLSEKVIFTGFIDDIQFKKYLDVCDVCISLRTNTRAGTSASVNHALGAGLPTIISDEGPFSEFPDNVVIKIKPEEEKNMSKILDDLYDNNVKRQTLSHNAQEFAQDNLSRDACVEKYVQAVEKVLTNNKRFVTQ